MDHIEAFNAMEAELRSRAAPAAFDPTDAASLRSYLIAFTGKLLLAQAETAEVRQELVVTQKRAASAESAVAKAASKIEFYDRLAEADGHYGLQNAARAIGAPPNTFIRSMKEGFLFYQGSNLVPRASFVKMGVFEVKVKLQDIGGVEKACSQTYVTPYGLTFLAKRWERAKLQPKGDRDLFGNAA